MEIWWPQCFFTAPGWWGKSMTTSFKLSNRLWLHLALWAQGWASGILWRFMLRFIAAMIYLCFLLGIRSLGTLRNASLWLILGLSLLTVRLCIRPTPFLSLCHLLRGPCLWSVPPCTVVKCRHQNVRSLSVAVLDRINMMDFGCMLWLILRRSCPRWSRATHPLHPPQWSSRSWTVLTLRRYHPHSHSGNPTGGRPQMRHPGWRTHWSCPLGVQGGRSFVLGLIFGFTSLNGSFG